MPVFGAWEREGVGFGNEVLTSSEAIEIAFPEGWYPHKKNPKKMRTNCPHFNATNL
ncbi:hypothetical protein SPONN_2635 [uncultured Candidatus Thioglobus sp.]|nr:hypothetical protein SPONN_2635 [uncultured Candidatus Thioglobus sp.]